MQLLLVAIVLALAWSALHYWAIPHVKQEWVASNLAAKVGNAGLLTVLQKLEELAVIGAITLAGVLLLVGMAGLLGEADVTWPKAAVETLAGAHGTLKGFSDGYGAVLGWLGVTGALISLWFLGRHARQRVTSVWMQKASEEHEAILANPSLLFEARNDPDLRKAVAAIEEIVARLRSLELTAFADQQRAELQGALDALLAHVAMERARKRIDFSAAAETQLSEETEVPKNRWSRLLAVLSSKKLGEDLGLVKKPLSRAVTALLVVALVGWSVVPLANSLTLSINNLRIHLAADAAARELERAISRTPPIDEQAIDDEEPPQASSAGAATRLLARAITSELHRASILSDAAGLQRRAPSDNEIVRSLLSEQAIAPEAPGEHLATKVRRDVAVAATQSAQPQSMSTQAYVEEQIRPTVERLQSEQPRRLQHLLARLEARYAVPLPANDAQGKLIEKMLDYVLSPIDLDPANQLEIEAQKLSKGFGKKAVQTWVDAVTRQTLADLLSGAARPAVRQQLVFQTSARSREFIASLQGRSGSGWVPSQTVANEERMASKVADAVAEANPILDDAGRQRVRTQLAGYDALFPTAAAAETPAGTPGGLSEAGGGGGGGGSAEPRRASRGAATGSRYASFAHATRSFRARGVVIGQDLEGELDVTDLRWRSLRSPAAPATRIVLELKLVDPQSGRASWRGAGTFQAGVLNQAIRYAADGRVLATTIMGGDGYVVARLTHLHPALVDTPLGCRIIESDRWVDTFTFGRPVPGNSALGEIALNRNAMTQWLTRLRLVESAAVNQEAVCRPEILNPALANPMLGTPRFTSSYAASLSGFIRERLARPAGSADFVASASRCSMGAEDMFRACLCSPDKVNSMPSRYWFPEDHTSQVRERPGVLSPDLQWLSPSNDRLGYLDFWMHTTFSLRTNGEGNEEQIIPFDFPRPAIDALRRTVAQTLRPHLARAVLAPSYDEFMDPLEEFVLAQRLVRAGLDGRLGQDFPVRKLLPLAAETRPFVAAQPTLRWEPAVPGPSFEETLSRADTAAAQRYREHLQDYEKRRQEKAPLCARASL